MTNFHTRQVGFLTYDLQETTVDCLNRVEARLPKGWQVVAFPIFPRTCSGIKFDFRPSTKVGKYFSVNKRGSTPEGLTSSVNWKAAFTCAWKSQVIVLFGLQGGSAILCAILGKIFFRKVISVNQTIPISQELKRQRWIIFLKYCLLRLCSLHIFQSEATREVLVKVYGIPNCLLISAPFESGLTHFRNTIRLRAPKIDEICDSKFVNHDVCKFLFVGSLLRLKGIEDLILAVGELNHKAPDFRCLIELVGPPVDYLPGEYSIDTFVSMAKKLGAGDKIRFLGSKTYPELVDLYAKAHVCILPTRRDTWGKVLVEAACCKCALLTTEACGAAGSLVVNEITGLVCRPNDPSDLADAMLRFSDKSFLKYCGENSFQLVDQICSAEKETEGYIQAIMRCHN